jgi:DNA-binding NarL/FixJ family response regulator
MSVKHARQVTFDGGTEITLVITARDAADLERAYGAALEQIAEMRKMERISNHLAGRDDGWEDLTDRERQVGDLILAGKTNREIGKALAISVNTVEAHRKSIYHKLGAHNGIQAARKLETK